MFVKLEEHALSAGRYDKMSLNQELCVCDSDYIVDQFAKKVVSEAGNIAFTKEKASHFFVASLKLKVKNCCTVYSQELMGSHPKNGKYQFYNAHTLKSYCAIFLYPKKNFELFHYI